MTTSIITPKEKHPSNEGSAVFEVLTPYKNDKEFLEDLKHLYQEETK